VSDRVDEFGAVTSGLQDAAALMAAHDLGVFGALLGGPLDAPADVLGDDRPLQVAGSGGEVSAQERRRFLRYIHTVSVDVADEVADLLAPAHRVLDLGSGLGTYALALVRRGATTATLVDRPNAEGPIRELWDEEGLSDRMTFLGGDLMELFARIREGLAPEGRVAVKDIAIAEDGLSPDDASRFAVSMAMFTESGGVYPASVVAGWLVEAGFRVTDTVDLRRAEGSRLIVAVGA